ncbi:MAG: trypsin-like peptidase domain-containing protein [Planctomycetes bacterium]|nr:trypsin-like peptidase domain-containing protein [Planctomycetota bacterium]
MTITSRALVLAAIAALSPTAPCQVDPVSRSVIGVTVDSGFLDAVASRPQIVFRDEVAVPGAAWLRLELGATHLPSGSSLRLTSSADGAVQRHDAASLRDYGGSSCWLNGERVLVELIAAPDTRANRVVVDRVEYGMRGISAPESICGTTDDRQLSQDPRVGRAVSGASACTWWLVDEFTVLTAGHCAASAAGTVIVGFNIPLSLPDGTYVQPHPDDQYPLDLGTLRFLNSGVGADWGVVAALRNSNHHAYPGQRQGGWFRLGAVPAAVTGVDIRITGNGRVSAPVSLTWNAVQKTHVGPRVATSTANAIAYRTDTTGGNSGSPIIHEQTGDAIGIHTHGGCSTSGGQNYGTRIDRADLALAIQAVRSSKVAGSLATFGAGCAGPAGTPALSLGGIPDVGGNVTVQVANVPAGQPAAMLIGVSVTAWAGYALPLDLGPFGLSGCALLTSVEVSDGVSTATGGVTYPVPIPLVRSLIDTRVHLQLLAADPTRTAVLSDGGTIRVGG